MPSVRVTQNIHGCINRSGAFEEPCFNLVRNHERVTVFCSAGIASTDVIREDRRHIHPSHCQCIDGRLILRVQTQVAKGDRQGRCLQCCSCLKEFRFGNAIQLTDETAEALVMVGSRGNGPQVRAFFDDDYRSCRGWDVGNFYFWQWRHNDLCRLFVASGEDKQQCNGDI